MGGFVFGLLVFPQAGASHQTGTMIMILLLLLLLLLIIIIMTIMTQMTLMTLITLMAITYNQTGTVMIRMMVILTTTAMILCRSSIKNIKSSINKSRTRPSRLEAVQRIAREPLSFRIFAPPTTCPPPPREANEFLG